MPLFGYSERDLSNARWDVAHALQSAIEMQDIPKALRDRIEPLIAGDPCWWVRQVAEVLFALIMEQKTALSDATGEALSLRCKCEYLQQLIDQHRADPIHEQIQRLSEERERLQTEIDQLTATNRMQAESLRCAREEITKHKERIAALNQIIVSQQDALDSQIDGNTE